MPLHSDDVTALLCYLSTDAWDWWGASELLLSEKWVSVSHTHDGHLLKLVNEFGTRRWCVRWIHRHRHTLRSQELFGLKRHGTFVPQPKPETLQVKAPFIRCEEPTAPVSLLNTHITCQEPTISIEFYYNNSFNSVTSLCSSFFPSFSSFIYLLYLLLYVTLFSFRSTL